MEVAESKHETRSPLGIDLNEIPSSSFSETLSHPDHADDPDSFEIVRAIHDCSDSAAAAEPAGAVPLHLRGEGTCAACGSPEAAAPPVLVCDACERGFHCACAGFSAGRLGEEWLCAQCVARGDRSKRWPLGMKSKRRILDINASPPSDGDADGEAGEAMPDFSRKRTLGGNTLLGNGLGATIAYSSFLHSGNGYAFQKASGITARAIKIGFEDLLCHRTDVDGSIYSADLAFPLGSFRNNSSTRYPFKDIGDIYLGALRDYISDFHGVLGEGWQVELKHSIGNYEPCPVYYAPDGKRFSSMHDVACYLGLVSNCGSRSTEIKCDRASLERSHLPRKRKWTRPLAGNGFSENKEILMNGCHREFACDDRTVEKRARATILSIAEVGPDGYGLFRSEENNDGLPLQFEDFFVLCLGQVDLRPSYHNVSLIYPIGYRSCWHDKITASLFICDVSDGGDAGPVFRVRRWPCSALPIPVGATVLSCSKLELSGFQNTDESANTIREDHDKDGTIDMILADLTPPTGEDITSCLDRISDRTHDFLVTKRSRKEGSQVHDKYSDMLSLDSKFSDEIGEISTEEHSLSSAWRLMAKKVIDICIDICKRKGLLRLFCKHIKSEMGSINWHIMNRMDKGAYSSLAKYCSFSFASNISSEFNVDDLEVLMNVLTNWLGPDRFGLDAEFVQEMIETLPGVEECSRYEVLKGRSSYSTALTVGRGFLMINKYISTSDQDRKPGSLFGKSTSIDDRTPPPGKPITAKLPSELIVDYHQVCELLLRFHEVLGLEKPLAIKELEHELLDPWSGNSYYRDNYEREIIGAETLSSSNDSSTAVGGHQNSFVLMETKALKDSELDKIASLTYSKCSGIELTKAHSSLLQVLISELQSKVSALVDPNLDPGELRSKRARRKDLEATTPAKRIKLSLLPLNEFTWPELARRYTLAVWSMDGNLDSGEVAARESAKVFRCLHGDGGILCGSLTGVAGMEADAVLLAEANKRIFGPIKGSEDLLTMEDESSDETDAFEKNPSSNGDIPEWARVLEPVRKLPTNVGTRIRNCVKEALLKGPPEWARNQLEHSISKEVYKGNASGPTKKAVLQVLEDVKKEGSVQKSEKRSKKKTTISISDILMRKCRIVLRHIATADDSKVFCNLLGRKLIHFNDNDDEGLLGSPAMVSRPLDFRTIDLRLAVGAYGGSHEAFLEDVHELWSNVRTAFADQSDMIELADSLSENFEALYENEVVSLAQKFGKYSELQSFSPAVIKEIKDIVASTNEIPTAPWEEGVCKICGIDKDDDSVLLCDTCDAEYHTYCLIPPLARIPEGNWYCPSCIVSKKLAQDAVAEPSLVISRRRGKSYQGEITLNYLEKLSRLAALMGEKDYWEIHANERTFLLKFLCGELLNSALVHQHLEQSAEITSDLLQKLRSLYGEWRNLKSREDFMATRGAKVDVSVSSAIAEAGLKDGLSSGVAEHGKSATQTECVSVVSDELPPVEGTKVGNQPNGSKTLVFSRKKIGSAKHMSVVNNSSEFNVVNASAANSESTSVGSDKSSRQGELPREMDESGKEVHKQQKLQECKDQNIFGQLNPSDCNGIRCLSDGNSINGSEHVSSLIENELLANHVEMNTVKTELQRVEGLIAELESQLYKLSLRRELLGSDSCGQLYWLSATPSGSPRIIVERYLPSKQRRETPHQHDQFCPSSGLLKSASVVADADFRLEGSKANCPFLEHSDGATSISLPWLSFEKHSEIEELLCWLNDDPNERELKEAIGQKLRFHVPNGVDSQDQDEVVLSPSSCLSPLATKAATLLERKYGTFFVAETTDPSKKKGKKAKLIDEENPYRCECLEPIWVSKSHCLSCHRTFSTNNELKEHNGGRCNPCVRANKENSRSVKGKGYEKSDVNQVDCTNKTGKFESSDARPELNSGLIKLQNREIESPFNFKEISSKFVTSDSNEELVQEIGLIGTGGIPSFVQSVSPFIDDSTLMLIPSQQEAGISGQETDATEKLVSSLGKINTAEARNGNASGHGSRGRATMKCLDQLDRRSTSDKQSSEWAMGHYCVVPQSSLRPLAGKVSHILRQLKINLLDMEAALPEEALKPSKSQTERRWAWRSFVKSAETIYEMVQATIILEDMIKTPYLRNDWWCWSSLTAAAKVSTLSSLALRVYALDAAIIYEKSLAELLLDDNSQVNGQLDAKVQSLDSAEKCKATRKSNKRRKELEG